MPITNKRVRKPLFNPNAVKNARKIGGLAYRSARARAGEVAGERFRTGRGMTGATSKARLQLARERVQKLMNAEERQFSGMNRELIGKFDSLPTNIRDTIDREVSQRTKNLAKQDTKRFGILLTPLEKLSPQRRLEYNKLIFELYSEAMERRGFR